ncbi:AMP-binding enzyme family protein (macronuclear) [Tetrahymena thermophila SB210]|uniref:AMP-binding enzyme family protein n=1 Tax=Tetrahymena thermophila (strain SB210) TaxID=312017 RepID=Q233M8_TETTS|nr:AMP-binding enzyme family protein [Tetrahymena thermophila SB210]EAR91552.2 AMP-binding enzyme family protein [Tetrahymena thermophila SB210]|eukprot:XP_001011797.2 AMP-binding enzyme family protein [Tetrahymena thermophila SB210]
MNLQHIDLFSSPFSFTVGNSSSRQTKKGTIKGAILSTIVFIFAIGYFSYLYYQFVNNQIDPNYKSQSVITEERIDIDLSSDLLGFRFEYDTNQDIQNLQASQNQTYLVFYAYFYYINGTFETQTQLKIIQCTNPQLAGFYCLDFSPVQNYTLTLSTKENYQSQVFIYTYGCLDLDFNKNSIPNNCANQTEINNIVNGENAGFRFKLFTSQFNTQTKQIQVNYRNDFVYALGNCISYTTFKTQKQITSVKQGFFIQDQSNYSSPIAYEKENQLWDREYSISNINQSGYGMLELIMNEIVEQVEIQYPTIPSILALVNSTISLLMILGYIGRRFSQNKIKNDLFLMLLQNVFQQKYLQILKCNQLLEQNMDYCQELAQQQQQKQSQQNQIQQQEQQNQIILSQSKFKNDESVVFQEQLDESLSQNKQIIFPYIEFRNKQILDQQNKYQEQKPKNKNQHATELSSSKQMDELSQEFIFQQNASLDKKITKNLDFSFLSQNHQMKNSFFQQKLVQDQSNYKLIKSLADEIYKNNIIKKEFCKKQEVQNTNIILNQNGKQYSNNFQQLKKSLNYEFSEKLQSILFRFRFFDKKKYLSSKGLDYQQKIIIEKQLSKDLNIFEFYKDILFLKKAVMILLSSEQLAVMKIIGCSSNFLEKSQTLINKDNFLKNKGSLNYFEEQYNIFESENLQFEKIEQFIKRCQQNTSLTEIDKRLLSSICI